MRRSIPRGAAFLVVFGLAVQLDAGVLVWYEAVPLTPNAGVISQGPGQALQLQCDKAGTPCRWEVSIEANPLDSGLRTWGLDLGGDTDKVRATGMQITLIQVTTQIIPGSFMNSGGILFLGAGGANGGALGAPAGSANLMSFTLEKFGGDAIEMTDLFAYVGAIEFQGNDGSTGLYEDVSMGPNPFRPGYSLGGATAGQAAAERGADSRSRPRPPVARTLAPCTKRIPRYDY